MRHQATLTSAAQGHEILRRLWEWAKPRLMDGKPLVLSIEEQRRTIPQNSHIHPVVMRIAKKAGRPTDQESLRRLRRLFIEQWHHDTNRPPLFERSLDGVRWVSVDIGTSDLDKPDCAEFIDWLLAFEAQYE